MAELHYIDRAGRPAPPASPAPLRDDEVSLRRRIGLQLRLLEQSNEEDPDDAGLLESTDEFFRVYRQQRRLLADHQCPIDRRIQEFLEAYLGSNGVGVCPRLPTDTLVLERPGMARVLSLPRGRNRFRSDYLTSYRVAQGVLHNPTNDRRTTEGVFHIAAGEIPVPADKKEVPACAFARLLEAALSPPDHLMGLPYTDRGEAPNPSRVWVTLHLRPKVSPEVPGLSASKRMETRFFVPGGLVANLDFVERIFGNAGDPRLPEHDAGLDIDHWSGTTGCVILAPHLVQLTKRQLGLPHRSDATDRELREGMCWTDETELYNEGSPFKIVCRDMRGVIVTIIADNYFGYSKKEVKSQISYSTNLYGGCEEEHAGGALVFPTESLGDRFVPDARIRAGGHTLREAVDAYPDLLAQTLAGYAVDLRYPDVLYLPEDAKIDLRERRISWDSGGRPLELKLQAGYVYMHPSGYQVRLGRAPSSGVWQLTGTEPTGLFCHKPSTVSGGGKSEISKPMDGAILSGPVYVKDFEQDLDWVDAILRRDLSDRFLGPRLSLPDLQSLLSPLRSLGDVIRLLTPSDAEYAPEYNRWLSEIPHHVRALLFVVKRHYEAEWGENWRANFSVDMVNGHPSHELRYQGRKLITNFLRVGFEQDGAWRVFKLRQDFLPAAKIQMEDDISVSTTVPGDALALTGEDGERSVKLIENCELELFQRPDEAVVRGCDARTELDFASPGNFISNYQPLTAADAIELVEDVVDFDKFSEPMQTLVESATRLEDGEYFVSSAHPRIVDGSPTLNVRYLQPRPDLGDPRENHVAEMGVRLRQRLPAESPICWHVDAVLPGRRNNPPDPGAGIRSLAVYSPIHYQELPELFMELVCSLTGKSPSTTGAGSEGALTKGPFNALPATADLNTALVSYVLCGHAGFSSAAGHIGPGRRVDHDISMLVPEIWCRMSARERDPAYLIANGCLERVEDFDHAGRRIPASRLGYRITEDFVKAFCGRIFDDPVVVFDQSLLRPETQDLDAYADGILHIAEAHERVARLYIEDGSIELACPPLRALLWIMAEGSFRGHSITDPEIRVLFTQAHLLESGWYRERLETKQARDIAHWRARLRYLEQHEDAGSSAGRDRLRAARGELRRVSERAYLDGLRGTLGADPVC